MTKKVPWYFSNIAWGTPSFFFMTKKVPWVLFENNEIHPPTLWLLLGMCSIKKVPAPPPPPPPPTYVQLTTYDLNTTGIQLNLTYYNKNLNTLCILMMMLSVTTSFIYVQSSQVENKLN